MLTRGRVTAAVFIEFLERLLVNAVAPVFLIVDGHPTHRAKSVARFVAAQLGKLALFFLPPPAAFHRLRRWNLGRLRPIRPN